MSGDYLWDRGQPVPRYQHLEEVLGGCRSNGPATNCPDNRISPADSRRGAGFKSPPVCSVQLRKSRGYRGRCRRLVILRFLGGPQARPQRGGRWARLERRHRWWEEAAFKGRPTQRRRVARTDAGSRARHHASSDIGQVYLERIPGCACVADPLDRSPSGSSYSARCKLLIWAPPRMFSVERRPPLRSILGLPVLAESG